VAWESAIGRRAVQAPINRDHRGRQVGIARPMVGRSGRRLPSQFYEGFGSGKPNSLRDNMWRYPVRSGLPNVGPKKSSHPESDARQPDRLTAYGTWCTTTASNRR
jgi:hypothetical protein